MLNIAVSETVHAPIERVFEIASDVPNCASFIEGIAYIETITQASPSADNIGPVGVGYAWREARIMFGKKAVEEMAITKWSPPNSYTVEARSHGSHYLTEITFVQIENQNDKPTTRMTMSFAATPETFMAKVMMKVFAFMSKTLVKCITNDLRDIKVAAEADQPNLP